MRHAVGAFLWSGLPMLNTLYLPELREMLREQNEAGLREFCTALHPARTADYMAGLELDEVWQVLQYADPALRAQVFSYFDHDKQIALIETQDRKQVAELIAHLAHDDRVDMLEDVDPAVLNELLPLLPQVERRDILRLLSYAEETAGAIMTTEVAKLPETLTVKEALRELARKSEDLETIKVVPMVSTLIRYRSLNCY